MLPPPNPSALLELEDAAGLPNIPPDEAAAENPLPLALLDCVGLALPKNPVVVDEEPNPPFGTDVVG